MRGTCLRRMASRSTFLQETISTGGGRAGTLTFGETNVIPTPNFLLHTSGGSVPHLTPDVVRSIFPSASSQPLLLVNLDTCLTFVDSLATFGKGLATFSGLSSFALFLSPHNPATPLRSGYNHGGDVSFWMRNGRKCLKFKEFAKIAPSFKPAFLQGLSDYDVGEGTSRKRCKKSITRSLQYFEELTTTPGVESDLFLPLELGWWMVNEDEANATVKTLLNDKRHLIQGFTISGAALKLRPSGEKNPSKVGKESVETVDYATLLKITSLLPRDLPIYVPGPFSPSQIIGLFSKGVDLVDSSWVTASAELGLLLNLDQILAKFQTRVKVNPEALDPQDTPETKSSIISIKDKQYFDDFTPISSSCSCTTCRKHSRAYLNHLYATDELLGPVLVMIHNLTSLRTLMELVGSLIKSEAAGDGGSDKTDGIKDLQLLQEMLAS